jgi:hypothetical protein
MKAKVQMKDAGMAVGEVTVGHEYVAQIGAPVIAR